MLIFIPHSISNHFGAGWREWWVGGGGGEGGRGAAAEGFERGVEGWVGLRLFVRIG